ncbi:hypothetical protein GGS23DRAFT_572139, partial [Durotheca rogersii]|uniref:uncharacterized protein n=1 Tax=Durotheca rogersii TaxID=419775 RepID=UPI00221EFD72
MPVCFAWTVWCPLPISRLCPVAGGLKHTYASQRHPTSQPPQGVWPYSVPRRCLCHTCGVCSLPCEIGPANTGLGVRTVPFSPRVLVLYVP